MGKDRKRWKKMQKDRKRYEKMGKDSGCIVERRFSCVANAHVLLNRRIPYLGGSWLVSELFLGFVSVSPFDEDSVYALIT